MKLDSSLVDTAKSFIQTNPLSVISINQKHKAPYATPVFVIPDDQLNLKFVTKQNTHKYTLLERDNRISVTLYNFKEQIVLQATGEAREVSIGEGAAQDFFDQINSGNSEAGTNWIPPIVKIEAGEYALFHIETDWMRMTTFNSSIAGAPKIQQIIS